MLTDPQVLQIIYLAIVRYFAARRQQKQAAIRPDERATYRQAQRLSDNPGSKTDYPYLGTTSIEPA